MDRLAQAAEDGTLDLQTDNQGQLIIYTGWFESASNPDLLQSEPDPEYQD